MTCPFCGGHAHVGHDELATCAACGKFVIWNEWDLLRVQMTRAERRAERRLRKATRRPPAEWTVIPEDVA